MLFPMAALLFKGHHCKQIQTKDLLPDSTWAQSCRGSWNYEFNLLSAADCEDCYLFVTNKLETLCVCLTLMPCCPL